MCYLVYPVHYLNAVHLSHFPSLTTFLFCDAVPSETPGRRHWRTHFWVNAALQTHCFCCQQRCTSSSKFPSKHCVADTVCPFNQWGWQCWNQTNRFKSTNLPSRVCSSFLEICHWDIFWLNLSRHLLFTDIALLTGGITEVVLHWQYPLAQCQSDSSSISLLGPKTAAAVRGLQLLWSIMIKPPWYQKKSKKNEVSCNALWSWFPRIAQIWTITQ